MKVLKIPVWWSAAEAEQIGLFLEELRQVIGQAYFDEIQQMHRAIQNEQKKQQTDYCAEEAPPF